MRWGGSGGGARMRPRRAVWGGPAAAGMVSAACVLRCCAKGSQHRRPPEPHKAAMQVVTRGCCECAFGSGGRGAQRTSARPASCPGPTCRSPAVTPPACSCPLPANAQSSCRSRRTTWSCQAGSGEREVVVSAADSAPFHCSAGCALCIAHGCICWEGWDGWQGGRVGDWLARLAIPAANRQDPPLPPLFATHHQTDPPHNTLLQLRVLGHYVSQPSRAVLWLLKIKKEPFELTTINPVTGQSRTPSQPQSSQSDLDPRSPPSHLPPLQAKRGPRNSAKSTRPAPSRCCRMAT